MKRREFAEWNAFHRLEPFGDEWRQRAMIAWMIARVNTKKSKRIDIEEFMPPLYKPEMGNDELRLKTKSIFKGLKSRQEKQKRGDH